MKVATLAVTLALAVATYAPAQTPTAAAAAAAAGPRTVRTYRLNYATSQAEQNEILTAIRNIASPNLRIFLVQTSNEIAAYGMAEDLAQIGELLAKFDQPHKQFRLTYTFTEVDGGKRVGLQHYSMVVATGQRVQMKEGSRVPIAVGSDKGAQRQYLDVGLNLDSTLQEHGTGFQLRSRVEQSSIAEEKSGIGPEDPVIRQTFLEGTSILPEGKAVSLGSLDVLGSTRHLEVAVTVEAVR